MAQTRRAFLGRGAVAAGALAAGGLGAAELLGGGSGPSASRRLARGVALGPFFAGRPDQRYEANRGRFQETGTPWVRMWADWPRLQPSGTFAPDAGAGARELDMLDRQVDAARRDGKRVMLTAWRFAEWANGTAGLSEADDSRFELRDRLADGADVIKRKDRTYRLPADLSPAGEWAAWIAYLVGRYGGRIDALELFNEPNLQMWPQRGAAGELTIDHAVAEMMETAGAVAARHRDAPLLVAPATADPDENSRLRTGYDVFTDSLLDRLAERRFVPGERFAWSHHNYTDVERDLAGASNRVAHVRSLLSGRWASSPEILVTESGARPAVVAANFGVGPDPLAALFKQAELIERALWRMTVGPEGAGVSMVCQYLFVTDRFYDSGLCELDGRPRPAYYAWGRGPGAA